jgi:hypothetical protein
MFSRAQCFAPFTVLAWSQLVSAQVPTASMPVDEPETATTPTATMPTATTPTPTPTATTPTATMPVVSAPAPSTSTANPPPLVGPAVPATPAVQVPVRATSSVSVPSTAMQAPPMPSTGSAKLSVFVKESGSTAYVFPYKEDPDDYAAESALLQCATICNVELPLGDYSVRIVNADGARSYNVLTLRSSRWISVAPAHQISRDIGFVAGVVGVASTALGVALLAEAVCRTCSATARDAGGAVGLGLGLPMAAIGWSLYLVHRKATIEDRILTQATRIESLRVTAARVPGGGFVGATVSF